MFLPLCSHTFCMANAQAVPLWGPCLTHLYPQGSCQGRGFCEIPASPTATLQHWCFETGLCEVNRSHTFNLRGGFCAPASVKSLVSLTAMLLQAQHQVSTSLPQGQYHGTGLCALLASLTSTLQGQCQRIGLWKVNESCGYLAILKIISTIQVPK